MTKGKVLVKLNLEKICALYVILWIFIPPIQVGTFYRLLAIGCVAIWFLTIVLRDKQALDILIKYLIIGALCVVLMLVWSFGSYSFIDAIKNHLQFIIMLACGVIATYYMKRDKEFLQIIIGACLICMAIFCVTTIDGVIKNPYAARIANSEWLEERFEGQEFVGLYGYIYMSVLIAPMLLYKMIKKVKINRFMDVLFFIVFALIVVMTIFSGYMIANMCLIFGCGLIFVLNKPNIGRFALFLLIVLLFVLFYKDFVNGFFDLMANMLGNNPAYKQKIIEIKKLLLNGELGGVTVDERFSNYSRSIELIYKYPIIGSYVFGVKGGGGHSEVLDTIGKYGWLIAGLYFYLLWVYPFKIYRNKTPQMVKILLLVFIVFSVFNPYSQEMCIMLYLFFPYIILISDEHDLGSGMVKGRFGSCGEA